jgi:two-component system, OmpR family, response regulator RegX3
MRVLVAEDDRRIADSLAVALKIAGFVVEAVPDGEEAWFRGDTEDFDAIILDLGLPKLDGLTALKRWRRAGRNAPVLILTARGNWEERVEGIEAGADDYVSKPFRLRELVARIRAVLRRSWEARADDGARGGLSRYEAGDVTVDLARHEVVVRGETVNLPLKEFDLLTLLVAASGRVLTRDTLIDQVWGIDYVGDTKTLDVHVKRLRAKIETDPANPARIVTIRGVGYKFVPGP